MLTVAIVILSEMGRITASAVTKSTCYDFLWVAEYQVRLMLVLWRFFKKKKNILLSIVTFLSGYVLRGKLSDILSRAIKCNGGWKGACLAAWDDLSVTWDLSFQIQLNPPLTQR